jgi:hypothetical protein
MSSVNLRIHLPLFCLVTLLFQQWVSRNNLFIFASTGSFTPEFPFPYAQIRKVLWNPSLFSRLSSNDSKSRRFCECPQRYRWKCWNFNTPDPKLLTTVDESWIYRCIFPQFWKWKQSQSLCSLFPSLYFIFDSRIIIIIAGFTGCLMLNVPFCLLEKISMWAHG